MIASPLIDAMTLRKRQQQQPITIINGTWFLPSDERDALACHHECRLPNAHFFDIDTIKDEASSLPHMLPSFDDFTRMMNERGISSRHPIVVYDDVGTWSSPRVWWHLRAFGHEDVLILHGGLPSWRACGLPLEEGEAETVVSPVDCSWRDERARHVIDYDELTRLVHEQRVRVIDARPSARFNGEQDEPRAGLARGSIAGSVNVPFNLLLQDDGIFYHDVARLREILTKPLDCEHEVVTSCGSGVTACIVAAACALCGVHVRVYDGSWAEWGAQS